MTINIDNFRIIRDLIAAQPPEHCDMTEWKCGTVACIGGWTENYLIQNGVVDPSTYNNVEPKICAFLGIDMNEASLLFYDFPDMDTLPPHTTWQEWMLKRLDSCIEAGTVPELPITNYDITVVHS